MHLAGSMPQSRKNAMPNARTWLFLRLENCLLRKQQKTYNIWIEFDLRKECSAHVCTTVCADQSWKTFTYKSANNMHSNLLWLVNSMHRPVHIVLVGDGFILRLLSWWTVPAIGKAAWHAHLKSNFDNAIASSGQSVADHSEGIIQHITSCS